MNRFCQTQTNWCMSPMVKYFTRVSRILRFMWCIHIRQVCLAHDDVIKLKHFPRYWPFERGIHRWPVNSRHKGQWRGSLMFSLTCVGINGWGWWFETPLRSLWRHCNARYVTSDDRDKTVQRQSKTKRDTVRTVCIFLEYGVLPHKESNNRSRIRIREKWQNCCY